MFKFAALLALASLAFGGPVENNENSLLSPMDRIVDGEETDIKNVPYTISIRRNGSPGAGGSIISEKWIVTAAHCFDFTQYNLSDYTVNAGSSEVYVDGSIHKVAAIIVHERWKNPNNHDNVGDIALMRLIDPFVFDSTRQPIELFNAGEESPVGHEAVISGWGSTEKQKTSEISTILRLVRIPIIDKAECKAAYADRYEIGEHQICTLYPGGGKDACRGDSGGPVTIDGRLAGIVSKGAGCARPERPGIHTEIAGYREWISTHTGI